MSFTGSLGSSSVSGNTPFGYYDNDSSFTTEGPKIARWIQKTLGWPTIEVELTDQGVYACFEQAVTEYSSLVNTANTKNWLTSYMGYSTASSITGKYPYQTFSHLKRTMDAVSHEAGVGGNINLKSASVVLTQSVQHYDLNAFASQSESGSVIEVQDVWHYPPAAIQRAWDPWFGGSPSIIIDEFGSEFGAISAALPLYYSFPMTTTILRAQAVEMNDKIRRSHFTHRIVNNQLFITPSPTHDMNGQNLWFTYFTRHGPLESDNALDASVSGILDMSSIPYQNITYSKINAQGKFWIKDFTFALAMILLGRIRSKYATVPIPRGEVTLDGPTLVSDGKEKIDKSREQLLKDLDETSLEKLMEREKNMYENMSKQVQDLLPLGIYFG